MTWRREEWRSYVFVKWVRKKADGGDCGDDDDGDEERRPIHILPIVVVIVVG